MGPRGLGKLEPGKDVARISEIYIVEQIDEAEDLGRLHMLRLNHLEKSVDQVFFLPDSAV